MKRLENVLEIVGAVLLLVAAYSKIFGKPHMAMGIRLISLIILANTSFLLAILLKLGGKK